MIYTTLNLLHQAKACKDRYRVLLDGLGGLSYGKDRPITPVQILDICGLDDALWALRASEPKDQVERLARLLACDYAEHVLPIYEQHAGPDQSLAPHLAIHIAREFAEGREDEDTLLAAWDAAWNAAWVARNAAGDAAWVAAWVAWDAAWVARNAAGDAAWAWQEEKFREYFSEKVK